MSGHTPGPWVLDTAKAWLRLLSPDRVTILAEFPSHFPSSDEDAVLMAAAPDLLEALAGLVQQIEINDFTDSLGHGATRLQAFHVAQFAITKARGGA